MKTKALFFLLLAVMLQACNSSDTTEGTAIDSKLRNTIAKNNERLVQALLNSDSDEYKALGTKDFVAHLRAKIEPVVWPFRKGTIDPKFTVFKEYHIKNDRVPGYAVMESEEKNYKITLEMDTQESYLSMLRMKYGGTDDYLLTVHYVLEDGQWKVTDLKLGLWGIDGKDAQDYYKMAQQSEKDGYILDAFFASDVARTCLKPAGTLLAYNNADKIEFYTKEWMDECNKQYHFPQALPEAGKDVQVIELTYVKSPEGTHPMFKYIAPTPMGGAEAAEREHMRVRKAIKDFYKGMDFSNKKNIYYRAYNGSIYGDHHDFKEAIK